jgi:hypothetical protein
MSGQMAFREVAVTAIREVLRLWQARDDGMTQLVGIIGAATDPVHRLDTTPTPTNAYEPIPALYLSRRPEGHV